MKHPDRQQRRSATAATLLQAKVILNSIVSGVPTFSYTPLPPRQPTPVPESAPDLPQPHSPVIPIADSAVPVANEAQAAQPEPMHEMAQVPAHQPVPSQPTAQVQDWQPPSVLLGQPVDESALTQQQRADALPGSVVPSALMQDRDALLRTGHVLPASINSSAAQTPAPLLLAPAADAPPAAQEHSGG